MRTNYSSLTPKLRFPGFTDEWKWVGGDVLFEPISNKNHSSDLPILALTQDQGAVPRNQINYNVIVSDKSVAGYKVVDIDDFIISLRSFQGGIEYSRYKGLCSPAYIVLRKKDKKLVSDFYRIYFKSFNYIQELNKKLEGIRDGKMVSYKQFSEILLPLPSYEEQQKIAECLSAADESIEAQQKKVDALKAHKKGLMQQLFPQDGETTPRLSFPGFDGEWNNKKLGDVATSFSGGTPKSGEPRFYGGPIPFIRSGEIHNDKTELFITEEGLNNSSAKLINKGDLLFALYGATSGEVDLSKIDGAINQAILCIRSKVLDIRFLYNYLSYKKDFITSRYLQGGQGNLSSDIILSLIIPLPTMNEQRIIASSLSHIDELIASEQQKLEALKAHKAGLMQQLFPRMSK